MKYEILTIGNFVPLDENGFLTSSVNNKIGEPFNTAINSIINAYKSVFDNKIHSIYVRGSVARGNPIQGFSDYDCFAVILDDPSISQIAKIRKSAYDLLLQFPFVSNFDLFFFTLDDLINNKDFFHWQFAMKVQSVCIFGQNLISSLQNFKPSFDIIFSLANLENRIGKAKHQIFKIFEAANTRYRCSWIMRSIVRCGFELVIEKEKKYTNELSLCARVFSVHYPNRANEMNTALNLAINPITNIDKILSLVNGLGGWLVEERIYNFGK